ncbi:MAG: MFS transporter [Candidatus Methanomethylophilaceae archaeon]|nr:MFS transporter [Candidatus Methanomethylophilaceae archaeon]
MEEYAEAEKRRLMIACCAAAFVTPLLSTMMNLSLDALGKEFSVGSHSLGYVNTAFLLSSVVFMVPLSRMADISGKRRMFLAGILTIAASCVLAPFSTEFWMVILFRGTIGIGAAAVVCTSVSMITDVFERSRRGWAIGINTTCVYVGLALGPFIGGVLNDLLGWRSLFFVILPFAAVAVALMYSFKHEIAPFAGKRLGIGSSVVYGLAVLLSMGGVINLPEAWAAALLVAGLVLLFLFVRLQLDSEDRILDVRLFRNRMFSGSCAAAFLNYASSYSLSFFLALYLQSLQGLSATEAGALMLIQPAVQAVLTPFFGKRSDIVADKRVLPTLGMLVIAVGVASIMFYDGSTPMWTIVMTLVVTGFGFSLFSAPNTALIMSSVPAKDTGEASAVVSVMRQSGMMVSMGIAMTVISVIMGSADNISPETYGDFILVMRISFAICTAMCLVGAATSMLRGRGSSEPSC